MVVVFLLVLFVFLLVVLVLFHSLEWIGVLSSIYLKQDQYQESPFPRRVGLGFLLECFTTSMSTFYPGDGLGVGVPTLCDKEFLELMRQMRIGISAQSILAD